MPPHPHIPEAAKPKWAGIETPGMVEAKCSLLLPKDGALQAKIKSLPRQRVLVCKDNGLTASVAPMPHASESLHVHFNGCTVLQLEPSTDAVHQVLPITPTVAGRCHFTSQSFKSFGLMMRTQQQSQKGGLGCNGGFDWPDAGSFRICPVCSNVAKLPKKRKGDIKEYWMLFYPLLQINSIRRWNMTMAMRTICRLTCIGCMEKVFSGMDDVQINEKKEKGGAPECRQLSVKQLLEEAGSVSFLQDAPPRPAAHRYTDEVMDAWALYNLWEECGAWEALQNDYRDVLIQSMYADASVQKQPTPQIALLEESPGKKCCSEFCQKYHGQKDPPSGKVIELNILCERCRNAYYCSTECRVSSQESHKQSCAKTKEKVLAEEEHAKDRKTVKVAMCDICKKQLPYKQMKKCSACRSVTYCSVKCQTMDWTTHKSKCVKQVS